jgi:hypothetical protein
MTQDRTEDQDRADVGGHIAVVHTVGLPVQMLGLVCKGWLASLHEIIDRQADDSIPDFLAESVADGLDLCHCDQYPDPWELAFGAYPDSETLHRVQVG